jgi:hypothetical protein
VPAARPAVLVAPFVFLAAALAAVALARVLVTACYREITKVI